MKWLNLSSLILVCLGVCLGVIGHKVQSEIDSALLDQEKLLRKIAEREKSANSPAETIEPTIKRPPQTPHDTESILALKEEVVGLRKKIDLLKYPSELYMGSPVVPQSKLDKRPQFVGVPVHPSYPLSMRRAKVEGQVDLSYIVDKDGYTQDVKVIGSVSPELDEAAVEAVKKWRYSPGVKDGATAHTRIKSPVVFSLGPNLHWF